MNALIAVTNNNEVIFVKKTETVISLPSGESTKQIIEDIGYMRHENVSATTLGTFPVTPDYNVTIEYIWSLEKVSDKDVIVVPIIQLNKFIIDNKNNISVIGLLGAYDCYLQYVLDTKPPTRL